MSSSLTTVAQLVAVIRGQLSSDVTLKPAGQRSSVGKPRKKPRTYSPKKLESVLGERIRTIGSDDPNRGRKVFRVFLESILLSRLGEHLINDPQFYQMVDDIQTSMEADPGIRKLVDSSIEHLISVSRPHSGHPDLKP